MMKKISIALAALSVLAPSVAFAGQECARVLPMAAASGTIADVSGNVRIAGPKGFNAATVGMTVGKGAQLLSGSFSSARLQLGNGETIDMAADQKLTFASITDQPDSVCLQMASVAPQFEQGGEHAQRTVVGQANVSDLSSRSQDVIKSRYQRIADLNNRFDFFGLGAGGYTVVAVTGVGGVIVAYQLVHDKDPPATLTN